MKLKMTRSSGNVFKDLAFPDDEAEHLRVRADLLIQIQNVLSARHWKQAEAARLLRVTQPRVSDLVRGRIDLFSVDTLIDMLARLGVRVRLVVTPAKRRLRFAQRFGSPAAGARSAQRTKKCDSWRSGEANG